MPNKPFGAVLSLSEKARTQIRDRIEVIEYELRTSVANMRAIANRTRRMSRYMPMISDGIRRFFFRPVLPAFIVAVLTIQFSFQQDLFLPHAGLKTLCSLGLPLYNDPA